MDLTKLNVVELNAQEKQNVDGGFLPAIIGGLVLYGIISAIEHPGAFVEGLKGN